MRPFEVVAYVMMSGTTTLDDFRRIADALDVWYDDTDFSPYGDEYMVTLGYVTEDDHRAICAAIDDLAIPGVRVEPTVAYWTTPEAWR